MKKIILLCALAASLWGCYDDSGLWKKVNDHDQRISQIETQLRSAATSGKTIADVTQTDTGWTITFTDNTKIEITNGKNGTDGKDGSNGTNGRDGQDATIGVDAGDDRVEFTLADGSVIALPRLNYSSPAGAFLLFEGPLDGYGSIVWFDGNRGEHRDVYEKANGGRHVGGILQDMFIADGKIYLLCQKKNDGDGQLLVCDARSMKLLKAYSDFDFGHHAEEKGFPQHLVVVGDKAFIQFSTNDDKATDWGYPTMERAAGIRVFDLKTGKLRDADIEGTYGPFGFGTADIPEGGAFKGRMLYSRGKVIAGLAKGLVIIDPETEKVIKKTDPFDGGVKDIVKGADGNLYIAVTGPFVEPQGYLEPNPAGSAIMKFKQNGELVSTLELSDIGDEGLFGAQPWEPNIGMCADVEDSFIYFNGNGGSVVRYDYLFPTEQLAVKRDYVKLPLTYFRYGYMGVHPMRSELFVPVYGSQSRLVVWDLFNADAPDRVFDTFRGYKDYAPYPSGVWFTGQFTDEYFAK